MTIILFIVFSILIYFITIYYSSYISKSIVMSFKKKKDITEDSLEKLSKPIAKIILPLIKIDSYKRDIMSNMLKTVKIEQTPEEFSARIHGKLILILLLSILVGLITPFILFGGLLYGFSSYNRDKKYPERKLKEKIKQIELELPRFSSTIATSLLDNNTTDVIKILESYKKIAGVALKDELETTLSDMKTGNIQNALRNLENRIRSHKLSELVRGLLSVSYGDNQTIYFQIKENEFRAEYKEIKKREIQARPKKMNPISFATLLVAVILIAVAISGDLISSISLFK